MSEEEKLKEDIRRMFAGYSIPQQERYNPDEDTANDHDSAMRNIFGDITDAIGGIIQEAVTMESIQRIAAEHGLVQRVGVVGIREIAERIRTILDDAMENAEFDY